jgi:hypothetical protein
MTFQEMWRASTPDSAGPGDEAWRHDRGSGVILLWWLCWLLANVAAAAGASAAMNEEPLLRNVLTLRLAAAGLDVMAALLAITVVLRLRRRQERKSQGAWS